MNELNEIPDSPEEQAQEPAHDHPTRLLRWLEWQGLMLDHGRLRKAHQPDAWWAVLPGEEEVTGPYEFRALLTALVDGAAAFQVMHESQAAEDEPVWITLQYRPLWQNPKMLRLWRGALWTLGLLLAYLLVTCVTPSALRPVVDLAFPLLIVGWFGRQHLRALWLKVQPSTANAASKPLGKKVAVGAVAMALAAGLALTPKETYQSLLTHGASAWAQIARWLPNKQPAQPTLQAATPAEPAAPVEIPAEPAPVADVAPATPEPEAAFDIKALAATPALWPKTVTLRQKASFPAVLNGRVVGQVDVPAGTQLRVATLRESQLTLEYQGATQTVPPSATDLEDRVRSIRATLSAPAPKLAPIPAAALASTARASTPPGNTASTIEEVPGIPAQPATYFGARQPQR